MYDKLTIQERIRDLRYEINIPRHSRGFYIHRA